MRKILGLLDCDSAFPDDDCETVRCVLFVDKEPGRAWKVGEE